MKIKYKNIECSQTKLNATEALVHMLHLKRCSWHLWHTDFSTLYFMKMLSEALVPMKAICSKWEFSHIF